LQPLNRRTTDVCLDISVSPFRPPPFLPSLFALLIATAFLIVYIPAAGRGFISDDFRWVLESRIRHPADVPRLFVETTGFYRPIVSLSFALNGWLGGTNPLAFGLTNAALAVLTAAAIARLVRLLQLPAGASVLAAGVWLLNIHGINMAVLWISGRTALFLTLFAVLAAAAVVQKKSALAGIFTLLAMLSKEEALLLPLPLLVLAELSNRSEGSTWRTRLGAGIPLAAAAALYLLLRSNSDAMVPSTAPHFYKFTFERGVIVRNLLEYLDRGAALALMCIVLATVVVRRVPRTTEAERKALVAGIVWFIAGFGLTVFLPVRSSLYACFPAVGAAIVAASLATAFWRGAGDRERRILCGGATLVILILIPIHHARSDRWTGLADVSRTVFEHLRTNAASAQSILLVDDRGGRANIWSAFGSLLPDAVELATGRRQTVWLLPPPPDVGEKDLQPYNADVDAAWMLQADALQHTDASRWRGASALLLR
jgi:hypothetical protein